MNLFPSDIVAAAQAAHKKYFPKGPYASVTLAQWAIESNYGKAMPVGSNNPFGIKAAIGQPFVTAKTKEYKNGIEYTAVQDFAKYARVADAFDAHAKLLATSSIYAQAQSATNVADYVRAMAKHYATAPNYAQVILGLIDSADLTQYDLPATPAPSAPVPPAPPAIPPGVSQGSSTMGSFLSMLSLLWTDAPEALSLVQSIASSPIAADIEKLFTTHAAVTATPGQAIVIEPASTATASASSLGVSTAR